jgi:hypothetical protein
VSKDIRIADCMVELGDFADDGMAANTEIGCEERTRQQMQDGTTKAYTQANAEDRKGRKEEHEACKHTLANATRNNTNLPSYRQNIGGLI